MKALLVLGQQLNLVFCSSALQLNEEKKTDGVMYAHTDGKVDSYSCVIQWVWDAFKNKSDGKIEEPLTYAYTYTTFGKVFCLPD